MYRFKLSHSVLRKCPDGKGLLVARAEAGYSRGLSFRAFRGFILGQNVLEPTKVVSS